MLQPKLLKKVIEVLEECQIPYSVTGSIASSLQGEPRATHDIDLIVMLKKTDVENLMAHFKEQRYYLNEQSIKEAITHQSMFNLIDTEEGDKVDFWLLTNEPFDVSRFKRRYQEDFFGIKMFVTSPEDTILAKLRWAKMSGGSQKQMIDVLRIYEVQFGQLNMEYIEFWVEKLDLEPLWAEIKDKANPL